MAGEGAEDPGVAPDPLTAHRTRTNTRTPLEPIGYDSEGAPLYVWQLYDGD